MVPSETDMSWMSVVRRLGLFSRRHVDRGPPSECDERRMAFSIKAAFSNLMNSTAMVEEAAQELKNGRDLTRTRVTREKPEDEELEEIISDLNQIMRGTNKGEEQ